MNWQAWATVAVIVLAMALFASEKLRIDLIALLVLATLVILGIVSPVEALSGFSSFQKSTNDATPRRIPKTSTCPGLIRPLGMGRRLVRAMFRSMSRSMNMLMVLAPPAIR